MCRLQSNASYTLASRKFNVFIDLFVRQIHFGSVRNKEGETNAPGAWPLPFQDHNSHSCENQLADGVALGRALLLELAIEIVRDIYGRASRCGFHAPSLA